MSNDYSIIITGATGFIGRSLIKKIVRVYSKKDILCLIKYDAPINEAEGFNLLKKLGLKYISIDLRTGEGLPEFLTTPKVVIHMAANTDTSNKDHRANDIGTIKLLDSLKKIGSKTHFIYFGTTAIMTGRKDCSKPFDESVKPSPTNEYGRTKLRAENYLKESVNKLKFRLTIIRLPTVYGQGARKNSFFDFIKNLVIKNSLFSRLNWPGKTSLVHVEDVVDAVMSLTRQPPEPGKYRLLILASDSPVMADILSRSFFTLGFPYKQIVLPNTVWRLLARSRPLIYKSEPFLPGSVYNLFWRASLVIDNVIYCKSVQTPLTLPNWKPKKLDSKIEKTLEA